MELDETRKRPKGYKKRHTRGKSGWGLARRGRRPRRTFERASPERNLVSSDTLEIGEFGRICPHLPSKRPPTTLTPPNEPHLSIPSPSIRDPRDIRRYIPRTDRAQHRRQILRARSKRQLKVKGGAGFPAGDAGRRRFEGDEHVGVDFGGDGVQGEGGDGGEGGEDPEGVFVVYAGVLLLVPQ